MKPTGISSPALRRAALTLQWLDAAASKLHRPSTRRLFRECRGTIADLSDENRQLRQFVAFGASPSDPHP